MLAEAQNYLREHHGADTLENGVAQPGASSDDILSLIDYPNYFRMMQQHLPENWSAILERLVAEKVLVRTPSGAYDVSNVA